jgi:hypothetical protein
MCTTPRPKRTKVLGVLAGDDAMHTAFTWAAVDYLAAVAALPMAVAKKAGTVNGAPAPVANTSKGPAAREAKALKECSPATAVSKTLMAPVAREAKASKECSPEMADGAAPAEVIAASAPVAKVPGPFHPISVVVEIVGTEVDDRGCSSEDHSNCSEVMAEDVVVCLRNVQIQVEGQEETAIAAYWVTDGVNCCHVGFLQHHMVRQATGYDGALVQVTRIFNSLTTIGPYMAHRFSWALFKVVNNFLNFCPSTTFDSSKCS